MTCAMSHDRASSPGLSASDAVRTEQPQRMHPTPGPAHPGEEPGPEPEAFAPKI